MEGTNVIWHVVVVPNAVSMSPDDPLPGTDLAAPRAPQRLFNFNFTILWQGQAVSWLGTHVFYIAMVLWIKEATGSAGVVGLLLMVASIPGVILGPIGGTFADRHSRKRIIVLTDTINGLSIVALAALVFLLPSATGLILALLFTVAVVGAVNNAFFAPAITAAIPDLVPKKRLAGANGLIQASLQVSQFLGQGLGGVLFRIVGAPVLFLFNGITFLFSAVTEAFVSIPQTLPIDVGRAEEEERWQAVSGGGWHLVLPIAPEPRLRGRLRPFVEAAVEGLRYVWRRPGMREVVFGAAILGFFAAPIPVLLPFFIEDVLGMGSEWYGFFLAVLGMGALVGSLVAGGLSVAGATRRNLLIVVLAIQATAYLALGLVPNIGYAMVLAAVAGAATGFVGITIITIVQATTPSEMRGRTVSLMATLSGALVPIAMGLSGVIADLTGQNISAIYVFCGAAMMVVSLVLAANRNLRELVAYDHEGAMSAV